MNHVIGIGMAPCDVSLRAAADKLLALLMPIFAKQPPVVCYWYEEIRTGWILRAHMPKESSQQMIEGFR